LQTDSRNLEEIISAASEKLLITDKYADRITFTATPNERHSGIVWIVVHLVTIGTYYYLEDFVERLEFPYTNISVNSIDVPVSFVR